MIKNDKNTRERITRKVTQHTLQKLCGVNLSWSLNAERKSLRTIWSLAKSIVLKQCNQPHELPESVFFAAENCPMSLGDRLTDSEMHSITHGSAQSLSTRTVHQTAVPIVSAILRRTRFSISTARPTELPSSVILLPELLLSSKKTTR